VSYNEEFSALVEISDKGHVDELEVSDGHVGELLVQTHEIAFRLDPVVDVEDGGLVAALNGVVRLDALGRHEELHLLLLLLFLLLPDAVDDVLLMAALSN
jgi:hypothetical protein